MTQTICDRCKSVIKEGVISITTKVGGFLHQSEKQFDLCSKCFDEFNGFMKQEKESASAATETNSNA